MHSQSVPGIGARRLANVVVAYFHGNPMTRPRLYSPKRGLGFRTSACRFCAPSQSHRPLGSPPAETTKPSKRVDPNHGPHPASTGRDHLSRHRSAMESCCAPRWEAPYGGVSQLIALVMGNRSPRLGTCEQLPSPFATRAACTPDLELIFEWSHPPAHSPTPYIWTSNPPKHHWP